MQSIQQPSGSLNLIKARRTRCGDRMKCPSAGPSVRPDVLIRLTINENVQTNKLRVGVDPEGGVADAN